MLVRVGIDRAATVVVRLRLSRATARRLHLPVQIGRASARLADAGRATLSARLGRRVRARLARVRRLALTVVVDVTGTDGAHTRVSRHLTLRR
jgi:hypothetical protein